MVKTVEDGMRMTLLGLAVLAFAAGAPRGGTAAEIKVLTAGAVNDLAGKGKFVAGSRHNLARVGVGVVVKEGAPKPDIGSVDDFKKALLAAKSVAYIDPAAGGSSGIYVAGLLDK